MSSLLVAAAVAAVSGTYAQVAPVVRVEVKDVQQAGRHIYHYRVINNSPFTVGHLVIGDAWSDDGGNPELPLITLDAANVASPTGWDGKVGALESSDKGYVEWVGASPADVILPGQTVQGFMVSLDRRANLYRSTSFTVIFTNSGSDRGKVVWNPSW
jgi:hypothetical protein